MTIDETVSLPYPAAAPARQVDRLPKGSVYRSVAARRTFLAAYDRIITELGFPVRGTTVPTRFGTTHVSIAGDATAPPLLLLPGMSICGPLMLEYFRVLTRDRMVLAPDMVGQPGWSADGDFRPDGNANGKWLLDVLDGLDIDRIDIVGPSFGGATALDLAGLHPERIGKLALIVTAGLTPSLPIVRAFTPLFGSWYLYRYLPSNIALLERLARPMCASWEPGYLDYLDVVVRTSIYWRHRPAGVFAEGQFKSTLDPVFIAFSTGDHLLPYKPTRAHAHKVLPIAQEMIMEHSAHLPNKDDVAPVIAELRKFLAD